MRRLFLRIFAVPLFFCGLLPGSDQPRDWRVGKLIDSEELNSFYGPPGRNFLIEGNAYTYQARQVLRWRGSKPANLTVNAPVKFAVEKETLFLVDEDGKEFKMKIIKRILRVAEQTRPPEK